MQQRGGGGASEKSSVNILVQTTLLFCIKIQEALPARH